MYWIFWPEAADAESCSKLNNKNRKDQKMKHIKKWMALIMMTLLLLALTSCGSAPAEDSTDEESQTVTGTQEETGTAETTEPEATAMPETGRTLVVVFSATGTTKDVAERIAILTVADLYEIKAAQEYTEEDLDWHDSNSRTTKEQNDKSVRPEIGSLPLTLDGYTTVFIGYPIWWGEEPRIMDTFVESHDFDGITVIPFCTSSSSGMGRSGKNLADNAGSGNWLEGKRFPGNVSESELEAWIKDLGL